MYKTKTLFFIVQSSNSANAKIFKYNCKKSKYVGNVYRILCTFGIWENSNCVHILICYFSIMAILLFFFLRFFFYISFIYSWCAMFLCFCLQNQSRIKYSSHHMKWARFCRPFLSTYMNVYISCWLEPYQTSIKNIYILYNRQYIHKSYTYIF